MNRAEKRRQKKVALKATRIAKLEKATIRSPDQQTLTIQQALGLAVQHQTAGRLSEAESIYKQILQADPSQPVALHLLGVIAHQVGKNDIAVDLIGKALIIKPDYAEAHSNLGNALKDLGKLDEAVASYHKALAIKPDYAEAHSNLGVALESLGKLDEAVASYHKALTIKPDYAEVHSNLGNALKDLGKLDEAMASYHKALTIKPDYAEAHNNLGNALKDLGKLDEAVASYHKALAIKPDYAEAHSNLGVALESLGKLDEAVASYHKALTIKPDYAEAHFNLGNALKDLGKLDEAVASYHKALTIKPDYAEAHSNLGNALQEQGKLDEAVASYHKALTIKPDYAEVHSNLGNALQELGKLDEAVASYGKALAIKPDYAEAHNNLGIALQEQGKLDDAAKKFDIAIAQNPEMAGWRIRKALLLPVIPYSENDIQSRRENLIEAVRALKKQNLIVENPPVDVGITNFYLAYHSQNNRTLLEDIAKLHIAACPKLTYEAKHCRFKKGEQKDRLRIGFLSSFFWNHTVGKLSRGIIEYFSRDHFDVIVFRLPGKKDEISEVIVQAADKVVPLYRKLDRDWKIIAEEELDILFYLDIGMDPYTYFLSFARLAPVQAVTIGHAESSGIPNIDYFLSSELTEPDDGDDHYSEQLIRLSYLPTYYYRPKVPKKKLTRTDYDLPRDHRLYVYPQTLFKLHPGLDATFGELLRRDPGGRLVVIDDGKGGHLSNLIIERFGRSCPDIVDQVILVPKMPYEKFLSLLLLSDAILDNPYLSGTNSGLEALGVGVPIIAWAGKYCSGNCVTACYRQMGLSDLIATDQESFLQLTLRLAQDKEFKLQMQSDIKENSHKLFERIEVVQEMEAFFIQAYNSFQKDEVLTDAGFNRPKVSIQQIPLSQ